MGRLWWGYGRSRHYTWLLIARSALGLGKNDRHPAHAPGQHRRFGFLLLLVVVLSRILGELLLIVRIRLLGGGLAGGGRGGGSAQGGLGHSTADRNALARRVGGGSPAA